MDFMDKFGRKYLSSGKPNEHIETAYQKIQYDTEVEKIFRDSSHEETSKSLEYDKKIECDIVTELQNICELIDSDNGYKLDPDTEKNNISDPIAIESVKRINILCSQLGSSAIALDNQNKGHKKGHDGSAKIDINTRFQHLKTPFQYPKKEVSEKKKEPIATRATIERKASSAQRVTKQKSREELEQDKFQMRDTLRDAFSRSKFYQIPLKKNVTDLQRRSSDSMALRPSVTRSRRSVSSERQKASSDKTHAASKSKNKNRETMSSESTEDTFEDSDENHDTRL